MQNIDNSKSKNNILQTEYIFVDLGNVEKLSPVKQNEIQPELNISNIHAH